MRNGRRIGFVAFLTVACTLAGCAAIGEDPAMDHIEAKAEIDTLFQVVQELVGGEWERHDSGALPCTLPSGSMGTEYKLDRIGPGVPVEQQRAVLDRVAEEWSDKGFELTTYAYPVIKGITVTAMRYPETGYGEDGLAFEFAVASSASTFEGQTRCVPGDADEINRLG